MQCYAMQYDVMKYNVLNVLDNHERLALPGLESLELRRLKADLCMTYKIMFNLVDLNVDNFFCS